jgi:hypothetical protein
MAWQAAPVPGTTLLRRYARGAGATIRPPANFARLLEIKAWLSGERLA